MAAVCSLPVATVTVDDAAFLAGLKEALKDFDRQAEQIVQEVGDKVVSLAQSYAPRGATGELAASIGSQPGRDAKGPYVEVGTFNPPADRRDFFQEFGTSVMRAHPFMRPALAQVGALLRTAGLGGGPRSSKRASSLRRRAVARQQLRRGVARGKITSAQSRTASRVISGLRASGLRLRRLRFG
jgi:HK97 gp10 family phage protein